MPVQRNPWVNRLLVVIILVIPVIVWFALNQFAIYTRSGNVDDVWFAETARGPVLVARDSIVVGTEGNAQKRFRIAVVDLRTGERLVRESVQGMLELVAVTDAGLWFRDRRTGGDLHARDPETLERRPVSAAPKLAEKPRHPELPLTREAVIPGIGRVVAPGPGGTSGAPVVGAPDAGASTPDAGPVADAGSPDGGAVPDGGSGAAAHPALVLDTNRYSEPEILEDSSTGEPIALEDPPSFIVVHRPKDATRGSNIFVSRVGADQKAVWTAPLERQRWVRAARAVGDLLVVVTSGAARDFAIALDAKTGATMWVHTF